MDIIFWAVLLVIFVIVEALTIQLVSIWLAVGALITIIVACFTDIPFFLQMGVFALSSAVFLAITIPLLRKRMNKGHVATNAELDIGKSAVVTEEIDNAKGTGRVTVNGVNWGAVSENDMIISKDSTVTVKEVKGTKLIVGIKN